MKKDSNIYYMLNILLKHKLIILKSNNIKLIIKLNILNSSIGTLWSDDK